MQLFLIRHAHALEAADDAQRPLSAKGRAQTKRMAGWLRSIAVFAPLEIWHSPLVRAEQTAAALARHLRLTVPLREVKGLAPDDDPQAILPRLGRAPERLALVGHEPHLSALASLLVAGRPAPAVFAMKKNGVLALEGAQAHWVARWQISPELLE